MAKQLTFEIVEAALIEAIKEKGYIDLAADFDVYAGKTGELHDTATILTRHLQNLTLEHDGMRPPA